MPFNSKYSYIIYPFSKYHKERERGMAEKKRERVEENKFLLKELDKKEREREKHSHALSPKILKEKEVVIVEYLSISSTIHPPAHILINLYSLLSCFGSSF